MIMARDYCMSSFGTKIKALRKKAKWTQGEFGAKIGRSKAYISQIENEQIGYSMEAAQSIADLFQVPLSLLIHPDLDVSDLEDVSDFLEDYASLPADKRKAVRQMMRLIEP